MSGWERDNYYDGFKAGKAEADATLQRVRRVVKLLKDMQATSGRAYHKERLKGARGEPIEIESRKAEACTLNVAIGELERALLPPAAGEGETTRKKELEIAQQWAGEQARGHVFIGDRCINCGIEQMLTGGYVVNGICARWCVHGNQVGACSWCDLRDDGGLPEQATSSEKGR